MARLQPRQDAHPGAETSPDVGVGRRHGIAFLSALLILSIAGLARARQPDVTTASQAGFRPPGDVFREEIYSATRTFHYDGAGLPDAALTLEDMPEVDSPMRRFYFELRRGFHLSVVGGFEYNDNPYRSYFTDDSDLSSETPETGDAASAGNATSDAGTETESTSARRRKHQPTTSAFVSPALRLSYGNEGGGIIEYRVGYQGSATYYAEEYFESRYEQGAFLRLGTGTEQMSLWLDSRAHISNYDRIEQGSDVEQTELNNIVTFRYNVSLRTAASVSAGYRWTIPEEGYAIERRDYVGAVQIDYSVTDKTSVGLRVAAGRDEQMDTPYGTIPQDYLRATIEAKTATSDKISLRASAGLEVRRYSGDAPLPSTATTAAAAAPLPVVGQSVAVQTATGETLPGQVVGVQTLAGDPVSSGTVARESTEILPVGSISLDYRPTQNTTVTLSAYTDLGSSSIYTGRSRVDTGALITLNQRLLGKLSLNLSAGYEFYTYGGFDVGARQETPTVVVQQVAVTTADGRQEIIEQSSVQAPAPTSDSDDKIDQSEGSYFFIRAGLTWTIRPWCSLSAFYEYMSEDASALYGTTGDYTRNRAVLQLALQL